MNTPIIKIILKPNLTDEQKIAAIEALPEKNWDEGNIHNPGILHAATFNSGVMLFQWLFKQKPELIYTKEPPRDPKCEYSPLPESNVLFHAVRNQNNEIIEHILTLPQGKELEEERDSYDRSIHFFAARCADVSLTHLFVQRLGSDKLYEVDGYAGIYPIHEAAKYGSTAVITYFVEECKIPVDLEGNNNTGNTPLMEAASHNQLNTMKELIRLGANKTSFDKNGCHAIHYAAKKGASEAVIYLVEECKVPVDLAMKNDKGYTPLIEATWEKQLQTMKELIRLGADKARNLTFNKEGLHPIHIAAAQDDTAMVTYLVEEGGISVDLETQDEVGYTPLIQAAACKALRTLKELIRLGANKTSFNKAGWHPIHYAASAVDTTAIITYFIEECGISVNLEANNEKAYTPLMLAAWNIQLQTVQELIRLGANKAIISNTLFKEDGWHPIHVAAAEGHTAMITYLVEECGISVNLEMNNKMAEMPLKVASRKSQLQSMQELIRLGADKACLHYFDKYGMHAIHVATKNGNRAMIAYLVQECGVSVDQPTNKPAEDSPLCIAAEHNRLESIITLIRLDTKFVCNKLDILPIELATDNYCIAALYDPNVVLQKLKVESNDIIGIAGGCLHLNLMKQFKESQRQKDSLEKYIAQNELIWRRITEYQKLLMDKHHLKYLDLLEVLMWLDSRRAMTATLARVSKDFSFKSRGLDDTPLTNHILSYLITANQAILTSKQIINLMHPENYQQEAKKELSQKKSPEELAHLFSYFGVFKRLDKALTERKEAKHNEEDRVNNNDGITFKQTGKASNG